MTTTTTTNGQARETFSTSRMMDFFSEKELAAQTGHGTEDWPLVALKELADNALDACEEAGIAPRLDVTLGEDHITITDNGPGIPAETVEGVTDYSVRVSSREAYVEPTRGAQGNALKTLLAMPFVLDHEHGQVDVEARGIRHRLVVRVNRVRQVPGIDHQKADSDITEGTKITLYWPDKARLILVRSARRFLQVAEDFAWINPHLDLTVQASIRDESENCQRVNRHYEPTDASWAVRKWTPATPPVAWWYGVEELTRLVAACIARDADRGEDRTVREFVAGFKGLSSTVKQKRVTDATELSRSKLSELASGGELDEARIGALLDAMKAESKPVKPRALGLIGEDHFRQRCEAAGCEMDTFAYQKVLSGPDADIPSIVEVAFAAHQGALDATAGEYGERRLITGVNFSAGLLNPFRELGEVGESLDSVLSAQWAGRHEPILLVLHATCPRVRYADRGKSSILLGKGGE